MRRAIGQVSWPGAANWLGIAGTNVVVLHATGTTGRFDVENRPAVQ